MTLIDALYEHRMLSGHAPPTICRTGSIAAGDGAFEFKRTASRLIEMQSIDYLARAHLT